MSWKYFRTKGMRGGELVDGLFEGKHVIIVDPPKKRRVYLNWFEKI